MTRHEAVFMDPVQHFEIPYKVRERAKKFYFQAFGWQLFDVPGTSYSFATTVAVEKNGMPKRAGAINGGLTPRTRELTAPTLLVKVTDLKSHLTRIEHAGGTILLQPTAMGPVWYARFRDPEGNVMGAIQDRPEGMESRPATKVKSTGAKAAGTKTASKGTKRGPGKVTGKSAATSTRKPSKAKARAAKPQANPAPKARKPREPKAVWSR